jgi:hypothetical protein
VQLNDKSGSVAYTLRQHYQKLLLPYEDYLQASRDGGAGLLGEWGPSRDRGLC